MTRRTASQRARQPRRRNRRRRSPLAEVRQHLSQNPVQPLPLRQSLAPAKPVGSRQLQSCPPLEKAKLQPSRLFDKSPRCCALEALLSNEPNVSFDQHRIHFCVGGSNPLSNKGSCSRTAGRQSASHIGTHEPMTNSTKDCVHWSQNRWYYHADSVVNIADGYVRDWFHQFKAGGTVWTGSCDNAISRSQRLSVKRLKSSDWPRDPLGPSWPSFPSITEWMEMIRKGIDPSDRPELNQPGGQLGFTQLSRRELNSNCHLATLVVSNYVVGIRATTEVPSKYLAYFRYSHNFLIMVNQWSLPIGLVRFLLAQWCQNPYSLWLRRAVSLKKFLRKVPTRLVKRARDRVVLGNVSLPSPQVSPFTSGAELSSDYESDGSSFLD